MKLIDNFFLFRWFVAVGAGVMLLLPAGSCNKEKTPDLHYDVTYSVVSSGTVNLQSILIVDEFGFERPVAPPADINLRLRIQPGVKAGIRVTGTVANGTVTVRLQAVNPENNFDHEKPVSVSGNVPQTFDITLEQDLK